MKVSFDTSSIDDYYTFLRLKSVPSYTWQGLQAVVPDEYASLIVGCDGVSRDCTVSYSPSPFLFDYQSDIARLAISKKRFAVFADCGLGKTLIGLEFAKHALRSSGEKVLWVSPLMVCDQTVNECRSFYGDDLPIEYVPSSRLQSWIESDSATIGVTNYEAISATVHNEGRLGAIVLDESSYLKSHYGAWGTRLIDIGRGVEWKLAMTGTPAPNDRIEFANHAVFLDQVSTVNEFLAAYFINTGETQERWTMKPHAVAPFYRDLSHWCIFLADPSVYGWKDNAAKIPPIHIHREHVELTPDQNARVQKLTGSLVVRETGGIGQRSALLRIATGCGGVDSNKPKAVRSLIESWPGESTIVWCHFNDEQDVLEKALPFAASIRGATPYGMRKDIIARFQSGEVRTLICKPKVLGFGLNLQIATRHVFNGTNDSYEEFYQAVKRSNRTGSTRPLHVHVVLTDIEEPMMANVMQKMARVDEDTREQQSLFCEQMTNCATSTRSPIGGRHEST